MPKKYRLVRTDPGVLDLSQVLDDQGRPIVLSAAGQQTVVDENTLKHPLVARYVGAGLHAEEVSLTPVQAPATPVVPAAPAPPPSPPPSPPTASEPAAPSEDPKPAADTSPVEPSTDATSSEDAPTDEPASDASEQDESKSTTKKKAGRSSKRSRGK